MSKPIVFYEIATDQGTPASFNTLKTELALIYKHIPYETVRVPLADVQRVSKEVGIPLPAGSDMHTLPAIVDPATGTRLADSLQIAHYLDERFPERPLFPAETGARQDAFVTALFATIGMDALVVGIAGSYKVLGKASQAVYDERLQRLGADIASVEHMSAAEKRARLEAGLGRLAAAIDAEGGQGGHVVGDSITFADIAVAAFIEFFRVCTDEGEHILTLNGGRWKKLLDQIKS